MDTWSERLTWSNINHESSRKAFETQVPPGRPHLCGRISITNLAERHLRLPVTAHKRVVPCHISITNLAERHLRHLCPVYHYLHFLFISITNLAERHLRLVHGGVWRKLGRRRISITNLAERHLRRRAPRFRAWCIRGSYINHESSRKAFETKACELGTRVHET